MNTDERLEALLMEVLESRAPSRPPDRLVPETLRAARTAPRWSRWLALLKEPPMRISSRVAVGSPAARAFAIVVVTALLALVATGAVVGTTSLLAGDPSTLIVAQDGTGTHRTITEAVAVADDGDTILVRPGTYVEAVVVTRKVRIQGDGPLHEIVIEAPADGPLTLVQEGMPDEDPYAILLDHTDATVSGLTIRGERSTVVASGGDPTVRDLAFQQAGVPSDGPRGNAIIVNRGSTAYLHDNDLHGSGPIGIYGASPTIEGNTLTGGAGIVGTPGDDTLIGNNYIADAVSRGIGLGPTGPIGRVTIERNTIERTGNEAIDARAGSLTIVGNTVTDPGAGGINTGSTTEARIEGNLVSGGRGTGITAEAAHHVLITDNTVTDLEVAVSVAGGVVNKNSMSENDTGVRLTGGLAEVSDNAIVDGGTGIAVTAGQPTVTGNTVRGNEVGIVVAVGASPVLTGNTVCGNERDFVVPDGTESPAASSGEGCPEG